VIKAGTVRQDLIDKTWYILSHFPADWPIAYWHVSGCIIYLHYKKQTKNKDKPWKHFTEYHQM